MLNKLKTALSACASIVMISVLPAPTTATVGGERELELLGYQPETRTLYLLKHDFGGRGCPPELWQYRLDDKILTKNNNPCPYSVEVHQRAVETLKSELTTLEPKSWYSRTYGYLVETLPKVTRQHSWGGQRTTWPMRVTIRKEGSPRDRQEQIITLEHCWEGDNLPRPVGEYNVPNSSSGLTILRSSADGDCFEGGYLVDTAIFFPPPVKVVEEAMPVYTVQLMASEAAANLEPLQMKLTAHGYPSYVERDRSENGKDWYRLRTGYYYLRTSANQAAKKIAESQAIETFVAEVSTRDTAQIVSVATGKPPLKPKELGTNGTRSSDSATRAAVDSTSENAPKPEITGETASVPPVQTEELGGVEQERTPVDQSGGKCQFPPTIATPNADVTKTTILTLGATVGVEFVVIVVLMVILLARKRST